MMGFQNVTLAICLVIITAKGLDAAIWGGRGRRKNCTSLFSFFFYLTNAFPYSFAVAVLHRAEDWSDPSTHV